MSDERLPTGHSRLMLGLLSVGLALGRVGRRVLPPLLPTVIADLSITSFQVGVALSVASIAFALLQFPSGRLSCRISRHSLWRIRWVPLDVGLQSLRGTTSHLRSASSTTGCPFGPRTT